MSDDQSIRGMVIIPMLRSVATGLLVGIAATAFYWLSLGVTGWRIFWAILAAVALVSWLALILPKRFDRLTSVTLDRKRSYSQTTPLKVSIDWNDGQAGIFSEMGITRDQFIAWCFGAAEGRSLGENHWCGSQGIFSKGEYHLMRDELIQRGLLRAKGRHHAQGYELTGKGRAVVLEVARRFGENPSPNERGSRIVTSLRPLAYLRESAREEMGPGKFP